jgi:hypothetical protein
MKKIIFTLLLITSIVGVSNSQTARAADPEPVANNCSNSFLGLPTWYKYLELDANCTVTGPHETVTDGNGNSHDRLVVSAVITRVSLAVIDILMRVGGIVAFGFIVYSGFKFTLSQGNPDQEKSARETAINAVIGMVITIFAIGIVTFIGNRISS